MIPLRINVDPEMLETTKYGAGAVVRIERSSSLGGSYAEIGTAPLVANQLIVEYDDATGTTSSWYRTRYSDSGNTKQSDYSPEFQPATEIAYATVEDFTDTFEVSPSSGRVRRIESVLAEASSLLVAAIGWDFYRHPASAGTEQRTLDVSRASRRLCVHGGVVSLTTVEVRGGPTDSWTTLSESDWYLDPRSVSIGESAGHVALTGATGWTTWPAGVATVRLTGVFGYATVPIDVRRATVALARQMYRADSTTAGGAYGPDELAGGIAPGSGVWPRDTYDVVNRYRHLYWCQV